MNIFCSGHILQGEKSLKRSWINFAQEYSRKTTEMEGKVASIETKLGTILTNYSHFLKFFFALVTCNTVFYFFRTNFEIQAEMRKYCRIEARTVIDFFERIFSYL
jgi:hypothetical protein